MTEPTPVTQRIEVIDMLRGVAVLGILLVNINSFALPMDAMFELTDIGYRHARDAWVYALVSAMAQGKFMSLFALLFGAGVALMVDRRRQAGEPAAGLHYRRLAVLAVLGFIHGVFIWYGDILLLYAISGALLYPLLLLTGRKLLWICVVLWALLIVIAIGLDVLMAMSDSMGGDAESGSRVFANEVELMRGGTLSIMKVRAVHWLVFMTFGSVLALPWALALMVTGVLACRSGWITGQRPRGDYRRLLVWALLLGLPIAAARVSLVLFTAPSGVMIPEMAMNTIDAALLAAAFAAATFLLAERWGRRWLGHALAAVGRMALTNYLAQSVICTLLFYGYGFGLFATLSRSELLVVVAGIWLMQLMWSPWWLSRHERGPMEALWRRMTYGRRAQQTPRPGPNPL